MPSTRKLTLSARAPFNECCPSPSSPPDFKFRQLLGEAAEEGYAFPKIVVVLLVVPVGSYRLGTSDTLNAAAISQARTQRVFPFGQRVEWQFDGFPRSTTPRAPARPPSPSPPAPPLRSIAPKRARPRRPDY